MSIFAAGHLPAGKAEGLGQGCQGCQGQKTTRREIMTGNVGSP